MTDTEPLQVGIVSATRDLCAWQDESLLRILQLGFVRIAVFVVCDEAGAAGRNRAAGYFPGRRPDALKVVRPCESLRNVPHINCDAAHILDNAVDLPEIDIWISVGDFADQSTAIPDGRLGTWAYRIGSENTWPPLIREYCANELWADISLVCTDKKGAGATILQQASTGIVGHSYRRTVDKALFSAATFAARACVDLQQNQRIVKLSAVEEIFRPGSQTTPPAAMLRVYLRQLEQSLRWFIRGIANGEQWTLAYAVGDAATLLSSKALNSPVYIEPPGRDEYFADGFGLCSGGRRFVVCEQFSYKQPIGKIVWLELDENMRLIAGPAVAIELDSHASFPCLAQHDGQIYCCPETQALNAVSLWQAVDFPGSWRKYRTLLHNVPGVDPILFRHDSHWWLLCTREDDEPNEKLYAWYADRIDGDWQPHQQNPVKIDIRSARNAGAPFLYEGVLHRPAQDCSRHYGWRIAINRIVKLSPAEFCEESIRFVGPQVHSEFPSGLHTIGSFADGFLFDAKKHRFMWRDLLLKTKKRLAKLSGTAASL